MRICQWFKVKTELVNQYYNIVFEWDKSNPNCESGPFFRVTTLSEWSGYCDLCFQDYESMMCWCFNHQSSFFKYGNIHNEEV